MRGCHRAFGLTLVSTNRLFVGVTVARELTVLGASHANSPPRALIKRYFLIWVILVRANRVLLGRRVSLSPLHSHIRRHLATSSDVVHTVFDVIGAGTQHSAALLMYLSA